MKRLKTLDLSYFIGKSEFEEDGIQNYLVFQSINRYFKVIANKLYISSWKSKGLSDKTIKPPVTSDNSLTPLIDYVGNKIRIKFTGSCLKQSKMQYTHGIVVNICTVYELGASGSNNNDPTLKNYLFGAVRLTKNADIDKYRYSGNGIGFDRRLSFSFPGSGLGQNILNFGADMSSSTHIDNKKKSILVLGKGPTQRLQHTLTAEKINSIYFTLTKKKSCLSLHYNGVNSNYLLMVQKFAKLKQKILKLLPLHYVLETFRRIGR